MNNNQESCQEYVCPICSNTDANSIGILNGRPYCRKCISFKGEEAKHQMSFSKNAPIYLSYELSSEQKELSDKLVNNYKNGIDSLVYAVTGSGKTEICLNLIQYCLEKGFKVGFAVPRQSICYELSARFRNLFRNNSVISVFGGHHRKLEADIVCLTTHQLYRYNNYFDLLIMDEIDAFPYKGNDVLESMFKRSIKGHHVLLTATPTNELLEEYMKKGKDVLKLFIRFHRHPLPVPKVIYGNSIKLYYKLKMYIGDFLKTNKQVFVFVPTINSSIYVSKILNIFYRAGTYVNSKRDDNQEIIDEFRLKKFKYLVTTAVLERGITVKDLQVIVFNADHPIYDDHSLIQIAGRAGRKKDAPEGEVIFIAKKETEHIRRAIESINAANESLQNLL